MRFVDLRLRVDLALVVDHAEEALALLLVLLGLDTEGRLAVNDAENTTALLRLGNDHLKEMSEERDDTERRTWTGLAEAQKM